MKYFFLFLIFINSSYGQYTRAPLIRPSENASSELTYRQLMRLINRPPRANSIDALIPRLPRAYRERFTLMRDSNGLNGEAVTSTAPRVIAYGETARTVLAFNGDPSHPSYNQLEMMEWNEREEKFEFRLITFPVRENARHPRNPETCLRCHGDPPRPNWQAYNYWPGSYCSVTRGGREVHYANSVEGRGYEEFLTNHSQSPRYRNMHFLSRDISTSTSSVDHNQVIRECLHSVEQEPNMRLFNLLQELNNRRIYREISNDPQFENYQYYLAGKVLSCSLFIRESSFFPENFVMPDPETFRQQREAQFLEDDRENMEYFYRNSFPEGQPHLSRRASFRPLQREEESNGYVGYGVPRERSLFEQLQQISESMGINTDWWSMGHMVSGTPPRRHLYEDGNNRGFDFMDHGLFQILSESRDPLLRETMSFLLQNDLLPLEYSNLDGGLEYDENYARRSTNPYFHYDYIRTFLSRRRRNQRRGVRPDYRRETKVDLCNRLAAASRSALGGTCPVNRFSSTSVVIGDLIDETREAVAEAVQISPAQRAINNRCVGCHRTGGFASNIPLNDPAAITDFLATNGEDFIRRVDESTREHAQNRMPLGGYALTEEERQSLLNYLRSFLSEDQ